MAGDEVAKEASAPPRPLSNILTIEEVGKVNTKAQIDGTMAGMTVGLGAAIVGQRIFRLGKNANLLGGMIAGVGAGYLWSKASLDSYLAEAEREKELLVRSKREANPYEGGFGGQEEMKDQYATTSGEH